MCSFLLPRATSKFPMHLQTSHVPSMVLPKGDYNTFTIHEEIVREREFYLSVVEEKVFVLRVVDKVSFNYLLVLAPITCTNSVSVIDSQEKKIDIACYNSTQNPWEISFK